MECNYEQWKDEYAPNNMEDDDEMLHIKEAVDSLNTIQKKIFLTYCEIGTYAGTAREIQELLQIPIGVPTVKKYIKHIREIIYDRL